MLETSLTRLETATPTEKALVPHRGIFLELSSHSQSIALAGKDGVGTAGSDGQAKARWLFFGRKHNHGPWPKPS